MLLFVRPIKKCVLNLIYAELVHDVGCYTTVKLVSGLLVVKYFHIIQYMHAMYYKMKSAHGKHTHEWFVLVLPPAIRRWILFSLKRRFFYPMLKLWIFSLKPPCISKCSPIRKAIFFTSIRLLFRPFSCVGLLFVSYWIWNEMKWNETKQMIN